MPCRSNETMQFVCSRSNETMQFHQVGLGCRSNETMQFVQWARIRGMRRRPPSHENWPVPLGTGRTLPIRLRDQHAAN